jgi:hypothetical protein
LSVNMFATAKRRGPLARATVGAGLALAVIGAIGLGSGVAGASPQQPVLVDDPVPAPAPAVPNPATGVNVANALFGELDSLLNAVFPGLGPIFMPAASATNPLAPGYTSPVSPGQAPVLPGQTPVLPGQTPVLPGQTPMLPGQTSPVLPGQSPLLPAQTPALPSYPAPTAPVDTSPVV